MDGNTYRTSQILDILGISRDTLRYYEERGIVKPNHNETNNYRNYNDFDIYALLVADFYKKRNLTLKEVRNVQEGTEIEDLDALLATKALQLEEAIRDNNYMLQKIKETKAFCEDLKVHLNQFSIRELPLYEVMGEFSDFYSFYEYPVILENMDMIKDDILSKIMRTFTVDENGFLDSKMYIVEKKETKQSEKNRRYLQYSKCIYTIVEDGRYLNGKNDIKNKILESSIQWSNKQGLKINGVAFINTRLITYLDNKERAFLEVYIPIEEV
ncbi:MerR family transcriptional regulator [Lysinibacillus sphaericus]|uniref:MerR family transcriptional regulator n=1 Tax=Lysinibacillus sphaericus TaxID=1421 RepID=A0A2S0K300_LYSSH|nr:MerR family transcriptional regulator [Lysinibacillus sphaericus]AVK97765.1 hypothetical protein LS41612_16515 [Lysinibacillus sphaericus]MED4543250.1 MerR family transcriptional regulator [Lysinibacillus sphaericus]TKI20998.1 MerR family transcriptional regulator [Lysinibacillus sphaericus]SUV16311.1 MerR family transcriptional regulator [Lysinibacillus sphaericus]GEC82602.1 MerR family transcriptional regulator [Lysinibacillus sphaericus]